MAATARPAQSSAVGRYARAQLTQVLGEGTRRLRQGWLPILQSAIGAGIAWFIAYDVVGHERPFFAPVAAVLALGVSLGQRLGRTVELLGGVVLGVFVGSVLQQVIGSGALQLVLFVAAAMVAAVLLSGSQLTINQAAISAVLLATVAPSENATNAGVTRCLDAVIGSAVGLLINAVVLPVNPLAVIRRAATPMFAELAAVLDTIATALTSTDESLAAAALTRARALDKRLAGFDEEVEAAAELARVAPLRWPMRAAVHRYRTMLTYLDYTVRNTRVIARRALVLVEEGDAVIPELPTAIGRLAAAVRLLRDDVDRDSSFAASRAQVARAVDAADAGLDNPAATLSAQVGLEQVRSTAVDLLRASGLTRSEALEAVGGPTSPPMSSVPD